MLIFSPLLNLTVFANFFSRSENNYWLYDLLDNFNLRFNNRGVMFRNLPSTLDAAFVLNNRFYFFKQNFFYLNDAAGNSLINPQLVHDAFLVGCDKSRLPREVDMSRLFRAPQLINFYCMRCSGYLVDRLKDKWNINNNTFVTVPAEEDDDEEIDSKTDKGEKIEEKERIKVGKILNDEKLISPPVRPFDGSTGGRALDLTTTEKLEENKTAERILINTLNKLDDFVLSSWTFLTHHVLLGLLLLLGIFFIIFLCQRGRERFLLDDRLDEDLLLQKGKARRREMRRRNRRWN